MNYRQRALTEVTSLTLEAASVCCRAVGASRAAPGSPSSTRSCPTWTAAAAQGQTPPLGVDPSFQRCGHVTSSPRRSTTRCCSASASHVVCHVVSAGLLRTPFYRPARRRGQHQVARAPETPLCARAYWPGPICLKKLWNLPGKMCFSIQQEDINLIFSSHDLSQKNFQFVSQQQRASIFQVNSVVQTV